MTKFIDVSGESPKEEKTVFTHFLCGNSGWVETSVSPTGYDRVRYLGECPFEGDMFAANDKGLDMIIYKGKKGGEFR